MTFLNSLNRLLSAPSSVSTITSLVCQIPCRLLLLPLLPVSGSNRVSLTCVSSSASSVAEINRFGRDFDDSLNPDPPDRPVEVLL